MSPAFFRSRVSRSVSALIASVAFVAGVSGCAGAAGPSETSSSATASAPGRGSETDSTEAQATTVAARTVSAIRSPMVIAHRGGAGRYPEETMEGFRAAMKSGFYPEMDIQFLKDGTPALLHDSTVDRTMTGVRGKASDLTLKQWRAARVTSPVGGADAKPATFDDVIKELGHKTVLVPEIKRGASSAQIGSVIATIKKNRLTSRILVQSFDYKVAARVQRAGIAALYLTGSEVTQSTIDSMKADGIRWFGPSRSMLESQMAAVARAGIRVVPYTAKNREEASRLPGSTFGFFVDDPWR